MQALAQSASIIHEAKNYVEIKSLSYSKSPFFEKLATEIDLQGVKYLPKSWRNLRDKIRMYAAGMPIKELVNPKNEGNSNPAIFKNNDLINGWIFELAKSQCNYTHAFIHRKIRLLCEQSNIEKTPSLRWVSDFMSKAETKYLIKERYGSGSRFNQKYRGYTPTQTAVYAGDCWQIDGTRVNIVDHGETLTDKEGRRISKRRFLYIVAVRDTMSGLPLGWEYCHEESAQAIIGALAMAVRNAGYLPYELIYDRFPGHNADDWAWIECNLRRRGVIMTITHKAEGKPNVYPAPEHEVCYLFGLKKSVSIRNYMITTEIESRKRIAEATILAIDEENELTSEVGILLGGRVKKLNDMTNVQKNEILQLIEDEKERLGSYRAVAGKCKLSEATISQLRKGSYAAEGSDVYETIALALVERRKFNIKIAATTPPAPGVGIEFISLEDPEAIYKAPAGDIVINNPSELVIVAPQMVTGDVVQLKITTQFSNASTLLKTPRSVTFSKPLTVK
jgi:hypothetical protein